MTLIMAKLSARINKTKKKQPKTVVVKSVVNNGDLRNVTMGKKVSFVNKASGTKVASEDKPTAYKYNPLAKYDKF